MSAGRPLDPRIGGPAMMGAAGFCMALNNALMKLLTDHYPVGELILLRSLLLLGMVSALLLERRLLRSIFDVTWSVQLLRGLVNAVAMVMLIVGLKHLPLNDTIVLNLTAPFFIVVLAVVVGERMAIGRLVAVMIGFAGVVTIVNPRMGSVSWLFAMPIGAAFLEATREMLTRRLPPRDGSPATLFHTSWIIAIVGALYQQPGEWIPLRVRDVALLSICALLLGVAQYLMICSYRVAEATLVAPFRYLIVLWGFLFSIVFFDHRPGITALLGSALIVGAGIHVLAAKPASAVRRRSPPA
jgi:drug/metabolite transporter (DMT)-like permease